MKVLVVTQGDYSSYEIVAIFDEEHRETAEVLTKLYGNELEEYELNGVDAENVDKIKKGLFLWFVEMKKDGNSRIFNVTGMTNWWDEKESKGILKGEIKNDYFYIHIWAKDGQGAAKIANEKRIQLIVENKWVEGSL